MRLSRFLVHTSIPTGEVISCVQRFWGRVNRPGTETDTGTDRIRYPHYTVWAQKGYRQMGTMGTLSKTPTL